MNHATRPPTARPYHAVRFYENEKSLARIVAGFLAEGLTNGEPGIVVAAPSQRAAILRELVARGVDVVPPTRAGDLILLDAADTLSSFMTDGVIDAQAFNAHLGAAIKSACRNQKGFTVRIYGQMVDLLWQEGKRDLAIRLELLWNQLANTQRFALLCGYAIGPFYKDAHVRDVCAHHTHVISADGTPAKVA